MTVGMLLAPVVLLLVGAVLTRPYSRSWGYWPGGLAGMILATLITLLLLVRS
jgi:hypothetical protein